MDHPHEADIDEIGLSWATPFLDDISVFKFTPDDIYNNLKHDGNKNHLDGMYLFKSITLLLFIPL